MTIAASVSEGAGNTVPGQIVINGGTVEFLSASSDSIPIEFTGAGGVLEVQSAATTLGADSRRGWRRCVLGDRNLAHERHDRIIEPRHRHQFGRLRLRQCPLRRRDHRLCRLRRPLDGGDGARASDRRQCRDSAGDELDRLRGRFRRQHHRRRKHDRLPGLGRQHCVALQHRRQGRQGQRLGWLYQSLRRASPSRRRRRHGRLRGNYRQRGQPFRDGRQLGHGQWRRRRRLPRWLTGQRVRQRRYGAFRSRLYRQSGRAPGRTGRLGHGRRVGWDRQPHGYLGEGRGRRRHYQFRGRLRQRGQPL